jgi:hypothetical protein
MAESRGEVLVNVAMGVGTWECDAYPPRDSGRPNPTMIPASSNADERKRKQLTGVKGGQNTERRRK